MAAAWARLGNRARAESIVRQAASLTADLPVERAGLQMVLGKTDDALDILENASNTGTAISWVRTNTDLHALQEIRDSRMSSRICAERGATGCDAFGVTRREH